jgi:hypothetical protein
MVKRLPEGVTQLLEKWSQGDEEALNQLLPLVYEELHRLAGAYLRREACSRRRTAATCRLSNQET